MAHGRGIYMSDSPGVCYQYGKIIILSRVLCNISAGDTLTIPGTNGFDTIYVIKNVANILPYCVINKDQAIGHGFNLDLASVTMAQSLSLSDQHRHLMTLAGAGNSAAAAAAVAASAASQGLGGPHGPPPGPNPEKLGMTNVSFFYLISLFLFKLNFSK